MPVEDAEDGRMALVERVREDAEPVLHMVPPALDRVHRCAAAPVLPYLRELLIQRRALALHHLRHLALHQVHRVAAGLHDGLDLIRVEEEAPEGQTDAQQQQSLRPQQQKAHDSSQQRQQTHALLRRERAQHISGSAARAHALRG